MTWEQKFVKDMEKWARNLTEHLDKVLREFADRIEEIDVKSTPICGAKVTVGTMTVECGKARFHEYPHDWDNTSDVSTQVRDVDIAGANFQAAHEEIENLEASIAAVHEHEAVVKPIDHEADLTMRCNRERIVRHLTRRCSRPIGHDGNHFDTAGWWTEPPKEKT